MDAESFDTWTRALITTRTRRAALWLLASGAAGGMLALPGDRAAATDCKKLGKGCAPPLERCCGGARCRDGHCVAHCRRERHCGNDECCGPCDECDTTGLLGCTPKPKPTCTNCEEPTCHPDSGEFVCFPTCEASQECCGNKCITKCDAGKCEKCDEASKSCTSKCPSGESCCGGTCVSTGTDAKNCGGCGKTCTDPMAPDCVNGLCQCKTATTCGWPSGSSNCCQAGVGTGVELDGQCCCNGTYTDPAGKKHCACMAGDTCACAAGNGAFAIYCCAAGSCGDPSTCHGC
jgi:hypothetical protein